MGRGSIGKVFLSFHSGLGIPVAVKILKSHLIEEDPEFLERFIQEGRLAVSLNHKNIVRIFDAGKTGESYYLVMELLDGHDVLEILNSEGPIPLEKFMEIACAVTDALIDAHEHDVIHRDIKPDNIMITSEGKIKLADLGLAKKLGEEFSSTMIGYAIGTPNYMSPEQAMNSREADARSDIYSLGATFYHMITGTLPFEGDSVMAVMMKHKEEELESPQDRLKGIPDNVCKIIMKMMAKNPDKRFQSCEELLNALNKIRYAPKTTEKPKTKMVLKTRRFQKPTQAIEELKARKEQEKTNIKSKSNKSLIPIITTIITIAVLVPVLLLIFVLDNSESQKTAPSKTDNAEPGITQTAASIVQKKVNAQLPPAQATGQNLLENFTIKEKYTDSVRYENDELIISRRDDYLYLPTKEHYSNFKLLIEYKIHFSKSAGKVALFRAQGNALHVLLAGVQTPHINTGSLELRSGLNSNAVLTRLQEVPIDHSKETNEWNTMEIHSKDGDVTVLLNGIKVSNVKTELSKGQIAFMAHQRSAFTVRRFELFKLE